MTGPKPPPDWVSDWGSDEGATRDHTGWYIFLVVAVIGVGGVLAVVFGSSSGPALVYDPQVVHRQITVDGRTVDCAVSHSGISCDWTR